MWIEDWSNDDENVYFVLKYVQIENSLEYYFVYPSLIK